MTIRRMASAAFALALAGCASSSLDYARTPPAPGPDIYKCIGAENDVRYLRIKSDTFQVWRGTVWGENACAEPGQSCTVDSAGKIHVKQFTNFDDRMRIDMLFIYDLKAGTEVQTTKIGPETTSPSYSTCAPHA